MLHFAHEPVVPALVLRRAGYDEQFIAQMARVMECTEAYRALREDIEYT